MREEMRKKARWRIAVAIVIITILVLLSIWQAGCNTMYGFGRDIKTIAGPYTTDD